MWCPRLRDARLPVRLLACVSQGAVPPQFWQMQQQQLANAHMQQPPSPTQVQHAAMFAHGQVQGAMMAPQLSPNRPGPPEAMPTGAQQAPHLPMPAGVPGAGGAVM